MAATALTLALSAQNRAFRALQIALKHNPTPEHESTTATAGQVQVILNPTKVDDREAFEQEITAACLASGYQPPQFVETTVESPGRLQAQQAAKDGVSLVLSAGGDGTVREVAAGLKDSDTALGILPLGTGNLLARNLNLPVSSFPKAVEAALTGKDTWIDLGFLTVEDRSTHPFLVMAGIGFDADIMKGASSSLKDAIGWGAYFVSGISASTKPSIHVSVTLGDEQQGRKAKVKTLLFASCGDLVGGITLLPDADPHDGWLDIMFLSVHGWLVGWIELIGKIIMQPFTRRKRQPGMATKMEVVRARKAQVKVLDQAREVQVDGDPIGSYRHLQVELSHRALKVRVI